MEQMRHKPAEVACDAGGFLVLDRWITVSASASQFFVRAGPSRISAQPLRKLRFQRRHPMLGPCSKR